MDICVALKLPEGVLGKAFGHWGTARCYMPRELGAGEAAYVVGVDASEAIYAVGPS